MKHYTVIYTEPQGAEWFFFVCEADDADHAEEQLANAYPDCADLIVGVYEAATPEQALEQLEKENESN